MISPIVNSSVTFMTKLTISMNWWKTTRSNFQLIFWLIILLPTNHLRPLPNHALQLRWKITDTARGKRTVSRPRRNKEFINTARIFGFMCSRVAVAQRDRRKKGGSDAAKSFSAMFTLSIGACAVVYFRLYIVTVTRCIFPSSKSGVYTTIHFLWLSFFVINYRHSIYPRLYLYTENHTIASYIERDIHRPDFYQRRKARGGMYRRHQ